MGVLPETIGCDPTALEAAQTHSERLPNDVLEADEGQPCVVTKEEDTPNSTLAQHHDRGPNYRPDIDGLRAVAVSAVYIFHLHEEWLPGGYVGVDVFFVISGFVVTSSLLTRKDSNMSEFMLGFYARRAKRLLPSSLLVVNTTAWCLAVVGPWWDDRVEKFTKVGMAGLLGNANNWMVFGERQDYWAQVDNDVDHAYHPFLHLWSLGVEEQFYVIFPVVVLAGLGSEVAGAGACCHASRCRLSIFLGLLMLTSVAASFWMGAKAELATHAFYVLPSRFWEMAIGTLVQLAIKSEAGYRLVSFLNTSRATLLCLEVVAVVMLAVSFNFTAKGNFPFPGASLPVLGTVVFIVAGAAQNTVVNAMLSRRFPVFIGLVSYTIYLLHVPIFALLNWSTEDGMDSTLAMLGCTFLVLLLSIAIYHFVEAPVRELRGLGSRSVLFASFVATAASVLWLKILVFVRGAAQSHSRPVVLSLCLFPLGAIAGASAMQSTKRTLHGRMVSVIALVMAAVLVSCQVKFLPVGSDDGPTFGEAAPTVEDAIDLHNSTDTVSPTRVHSQTKDEQTKDSLGGARCECRFTTQTFHKPPEAVVSSASTKHLSPCFNDHAVDLPRAPAMNPDDLKPNRATPVLFMIGDSHAALLIRVLGKLLTRKMIRQDIRYTHSDSVPDTILKNLNTFAIPGDIFGFARIQGSMKHYAESVDKLVSLAKNKNALVLLFTDNPSFKGSVRSCASSRKSPTKCGRSLKVARSRINLTKEINRAAARSNAHVLAVDQHDWFCDSRNCDVFVPGTWKLAYRDANHLGPLGLNYLLPFMCSAIKGFGGLTPALP
eukprot:TRINITY_DN48278_c0_g1_i1.p1 TRINITY_DN48278_c0_g1~~TRINITY_DN48278_c0_g1_i1.p1  ORF type:complete len:824 (-),score=110.72 TRINITY_DN48278_c0_g1_i1:149-2620(-)